MPKLYLAIDNCFASKRWTKPQEWMEIIRDLGIEYAETSADTECDPLYMGMDYMKRWADAVAMASMKTGVKVANLYSGHGTYSTLGLAHSDHAVADRFLENWLKPMADTAQILGAGLGFYCHAFSDSVLNDHKLYKEAENALIERLAKLSEYCGIKKMGPVGCEQMYTPHQIPWTLSGTGDFLSEIFNKSGNPFYITLDTGHQSGQHKFVKPSVQIITEYLNEYRKGNEKDGLWLGPKKAYNQFLNQVKEGVEVSEAANRVLACMEGYEHMFAQKEDGETYKWLRELGCYSPIIHLQQTDGASSGHKPFTAKYNEVGKIKGELVLAALREAYKQPENPRMPPKCDKIYLTLELFTSTADINFDALKSYRQSVEYWRQFIPQDGCEL